MIDSILKTICSLLEDGFTVYYVDKDANRRGLVRDITSDYQRLEVTNGCLVGESVIHFNALIIVNPHLYETQKIKEFHNIPGYFAGVKPMTMEITLD